MTKQTNKNNRDQNLPANLVTPTYRHAWPYHANEENLHHPKRLMEMENIKNLPLLKILTFYKWMWEMVLWPFTPHRYHTMLIVLSPIPTPSPNPSPALAGALKHQLLRSVQHRLKSIFSSNLSLIQINTPFLSHFDTVSCHPNKKNKVFSSTFTRKKYSF